MAAAAGRVALVLMVLAPAWPAIAAEKVPAGLAGVIHDLRQGGYVIYFRHAATDSLLAPYEIDDPARCETQQNLSAAGRAQAKRIGHAIKALGIPIGSVVASPSCRTRDTARLAFGHVETDKDLAYVIDTGVDETRRLGAALRRMLSMPPARGTNAVLVSHSANLFEAAGIFAKPEGAAYVFRPLADGRFEPVAKVLPADWIRLARHRNGAR